ncbi:MAG TPA: tellurite resistance/C4-dicarboxylate transporter family protein [Blastocatellia bacterium]|jgi:tellurite resistance protein TehA-like permease|nr:tellurite resistance/C4-dicarboxylate transporter family protein [Blastocatellia bacterium]
MKWNGGRIKRFLDQAVENLFPGYFSLVMATGIISVASYQLEMRTIGWALLVINIVAYLILWSLTLLRLARFFTRALSDLTSHARGPGFFTLVAGTCVLGAQMVIITGSFIVAVFLWLCGLALWLMMMYTFFTAVIIREEKPALETGIDGSWLLAVVATQSVSVLGTLLAPHFNAGRELLLFFTLGIYLIGCALYLSLITLIFYRLIFVKLTAAEFTPPYWIDMGAVAITTLAGSALILNAPQWLFLREILPFLTGFTLLFWAAGTWWIPLLVILGVWRHVYKRFPLTYDPQYWGMVFPLGMYTAGTFQLSKVMGLSLLLNIPRFFIYIALTAWLASFVGLIKSLAERSRRYGGRRISFAHRPENQSPE